MSVVDAILLGIIQGITEFLPISSTAHLTIAGKLFGLIDLQHPEEWTAFIAIIQLGTIVAVVAFFWREIIAIIRDLWKDIRSNSTPSGSAKKWSINSRHAFQIVIGTIPVVVFGFLFKDIIEGQLTKSIPVIATNLILLAVILYWAEKTKRHVRDESQTTWKDALLIGLGQACALIPGASRSGTTITAALFLGFTRPAAARFSFLLSIPAVLASGLFQVYQLRSLSVHLDLAAVIIAMMVSGVTGYLAIVLLLRYLKTHSTFVFVGYRIALGILLWVLFLTGKI